MKQVEVRLFAAFREAAGIESERRETCAENALQLFEEVCSAHERLRPESTALVAINDTMAEWNSPVRDGDKVLFFPPVAGG